VDFVRRYYEKHYGLTFKGVEKAADMVHIRSLYDAEGQRRPWKTAGSIGKGSVIVWAAEGRYAPTGHVAVVTRVHDKEGTVTVAEINERGDNKFGRRKVTLGRQTTTRIVRVLEAPT
jgi:hypothetical protein